MSMMSRWTGGWLGLVLVSGTAYADDLRLINAIKHGDRQAVLTLSRGRIDVNATQPEGATALHWAAHLNDLDTATLLLKAHARVDVANDYGVTPLSLAARNASAAMLELLLNAGADPDRARRSGETPLMTVSAAGNVDALNVVLNRGANVNASDEHAQTALMWAISQKHHGVVSELLARGADIRARSRTGYSPLLFAVRGGDLDIARTLVARGADVNDTAPDGSSALLIATVKGHTAVVKLLAERGADINADGAGFTALHWAVGNWHTQMTGPNGIVTDSGSWQGLNGLEGEEKVQLVKLLLTHGANPNSRLKKPPPRIGFSGSSMALTGATPFILAAMAEPAIMRVLLDAGADPLATTDGQANAMMVAAGLGRGVGESRLPERSALEAVSLCIELGLDVNAVDVFGDTPIFGAAAWGADSIIQFLADHGASVDLKNIQGVTPLMVADGTVRVSFANTNRPSTAALLQKLVADQTNAPRPRP